MATGSALRHSSSPAIQFKSPTVQPLFPSCVDEAIRPLPQPTCHVGGRRVRNTFISDTVVILNKLDDAGL